MKIVSYDIARLTVLFPFEEVGPIESVSPLDIVNDVLSRYRFLKGPDLSLSPAELQKVGLKFEKGSLNIGDTSINIPEFTVFNDGVVIDSRTTHDAEQFWENIVPWLIERHGFRPFTIGPKLRYLSQLIVEFERPLSGLVRGYHDIFEIISSQLNAIYAAQVPVNLARIDFAFDKIGQQSSLMVPGFIIERRQGIPFARERYFCSAPFKTRDHIATLERLEALSSV